MTRRRLFCLPLCGALPSLAQQPSAKDDVLLRALRDELERSRDLRVVDLAKPYFIEYGVHDSDSFAVSATLGAIYSVQKGRLRLPRIRVRVGDYSFDNGNYLYTDAAFASRYNQGACPVDDDYAALRQYFWLATDTAYKSALEVIARKRAAQKNITVTDQLPDLAKVEPLTMTEPGAKSPIDEEAWKARVRGVSALFAREPRIIGSSVEFQAVQGTYYLVTSEGTRVEAPETSFHFLVRATALASDGMTLRDTAGHYALALEGLPPETELRRSAAGVADHLGALLEAPIAEAYTGPVLFEPEAAAQIFAEVLGRSFVLRRRPVSEPGRPLPFVSSELEGRLGSRILPEWMDVVDDPTATEWRGRRLFGRYRVDLEGVAPKPLVLVEKGLLRNYLTTRQPMRGAEGSNGHARLLGSFGADAASFGNLFVRASQTTTLPELKKALLGLVAQRGLAYGLLVRKMDFPSSASLPEAQRMLAAMSQDGSAQRPVSSPTLAYRIYSDGREELVRGLRFKEFTVRSFRDLQSAGGEPAVFDYVENGAPFALMGAASFVAESSVISPGMLFEELQLVKAQDELPTLPIVAPPPLTAAL